MSNRNKLNTRRSAQNGFVRAIKKFLLSGFVVFSFIAYALENHRAAPAVAGPSTDTAPPPVVAPPTAEATTPPSAVAPPAAEATATGDSIASSGSTTGSGYKDGTYTGPSIWVDWGNVQVQATIQGGKITDVQFVQYPSDRRTSQRINSIADPMLDQEAIQAQSANVDFITGATLTSEGFAQSLQAALDQARG